MSEIEEKKPKIEIFKEWPRYVIEQGIKPEHIEARKKDCPEGSHFVPQFRWYDFQSNRLKKKTQGHDVIWPACITCPKGYELAYEYRSETKYKTEISAANYEEVDKDGYKTGKTKTVMATQVIPVCQKTKAEQERTFLAGKNLSNLDLYHRGKPSEFQRMWIEARERGQEYFFPVEGELEKRIGTVPCGMLYRTICPGETEDIYRASLADYRNINKRYQNNDDELRKQIARRRGSAYYESVNKEGEPALALTDTRIIPGFTVDKMSKYKTVQVNLHKKASTELRELNYKWTDWVGAIYKKGLTTAVSFIKWSKNIPDLEFDPPSVVIEKKWAKVAKLPQCPKLNVPDIDVNINHKNHNFQFLFKQFYVDIAAAQMKAALDPVKIAAPAKWETNFVFEEAHAKVYIKARELGLLTDTTAPQKPRWTLDDRLADLRGQTLERDGKSLFFDEGMAGIVTRQLAFSRAEGVAKGRPRVDIKFKVIQNNVGDIVIEKNFMEYGPGPDGKMIFSSERGDGGFTDFLVKYFGIKGLDPITYEGLKRAHKWLQLGTITKKHRNKMGKRLRKRRKLPPVLKKFLKQNPNARARFFKRLVGTYESSRTNHLIHTAFAFESFIKELKADDFKVVIYPKDSQKAAGHKKYLGAEFSPISSEALDRDYQRAAMYGLRSQGKVLPGAVATVTGVPLESIKFNNKAKDVRKSIKLDSFILKQTQKSTKLLETSLQPFYKNLTNLQVFDANGRPGFKVTLNEDEGTVVYMFGDSEESPVPKGIERKKIFDLDIGPQENKIKNAGQKVEPLRYSDLFGEWNSAASGEGLQLTYLNTQKCLIDAKITKKLPGLWGAGIEVTGTNICDELGPIQYALVPKDGKVFASAEKRLFDLLGINTNSGVRYIDVDTIEFATEGQTKGLQKESKINFNDIIAIINEYISDE